MMDKVAGASCGTAGGALAGIRVVDLTTVVVGPTATLYLADYGADVIKVEAPGGDLLRSLGGQSKSGELSGKFMHFNRNKRSIVLDLKQARGREALHRLLATADVFIANVRPAALERLGLGAAALHERYARLIICNLMGFGRGGRYRDRPAYDTIIQGLAGVADCNRRAGGEPRYVPMVFADHVVGLIATQCIMAALFARERTGQGQAIEVPMFENMAAFVLAEHMGDLAFVPSRGGSGDLRVLDPMGKPIATADGYICVSANTDAQAFALFDAIGRAELKSDPRFSSVKARLANVRAYFDVRAESFRTRTTDEWIEILARADVPAGRMHTLDSLLADEHLADVGFFREVDHPVEGGIVDMKFSNRFSAGGREDYLPPPLVGGDNVAILREIGYGGEEVDAMLESKVTIDGRTSSPSPLVGEGRGGGSGGCGTLVPHTPTPTQEADPLPSPQGGGEKQSE
jgi:crotonobetainyl-CoA:carnitine CoA-transferase CaiB-like acyl-CoA transferase